MGSIGDVPSKRWSASILNTRNMTAKASVSHHELSGLILWHCIEIFPGRTNSCPDFGQLSSLSRLSIIQATGRVELQFIWKFIYSSVYSFWHKRSIRLHGVPRIEYINAGKEGFAEIGDFIPIAWSIISQRWYRKRGNKTPAESPQIKQLFLLLQKQTNAIEMLANTVIMLTLAATGFSQVPAGYRTVYLSSMVNTKLVIAPKNPVKSGTTIVVQTLNNKPDQQWYLNDGNSTIRLAATTFCLDAGAKSKYRHRIKPRTCSNLMQIVG